MTTGSEDAARRRTERLALGCWAVASLVMATICGAVIVSGWFAGVITDAYERVFWTGALLAGLMVAVLTAAVWPGGADGRRTIRRITVLVRIGLLLFVLAPTLCIGALVADFFW